jgi:uncharacterized membrane protein HdeD (DUF308 family)
MSGYASGASSSNMEKHLICGLLIPPGLLVFTGLVITAVRKKFVWSSFYLGLELVLAGLADGLINFVERLHSVDDRPYMVNGSFVSMLIWYLVFAILAVGTLFIVIVINQRWEEFLPHDQYDELKLKRGVWLGVIANLLGIVVLGAFIYMRLEDIV